tara:strand:+ start:17580 stop:18998 length:1419 start_codon:yes stop_codon:yes gene_type:complete
MSIVRFNKLKFDKLLDIQQRTIDSKDRPEVLNKVRKLLFFLLREGVFRTLSKIKSKKNKDLILNKALTLITVEHEESIYVNYSTQTTNNSDNYIINNIFYLLEEQVKITDINNEDIFNQFVYHKNDSVKTIELELVSQVPSINNQSKGVFIYGLGDYSRVYVARNISKIPKICCVDYSYNLATYYKDKFNYDDYCLVAEDSYPKLVKTKYPLAIIATYHSDHTRIAREIFEKNPNTLIFIEKPPCVTIDDIKTLLSLYSQNAKIEIGYNRRFIPLNKEIRDLIYDKQKVISISVKEILINDNHWYFWQNQGTRITGNLTHWIDLSIFWINGSPKEVNLIASPSEDETIAVSILFSEGSLVNITVSDKGSSLRGVQERIEIRTVDETLLIEDYVKYTRLCSNGRKIVKRKFMRIKGHDAMYQHLIKVYNNKETIQYSKKDLIYSGLTTFYISEMYKNGFRNLDIDSKIKSFYN